MKAKEVDQQESRINILLYFLRECANQQCVFGSSTLPGCVEERDLCRKILKDIGVPAIATYQAW